MSAVVTLIRVYKESMVTMSPCSLILLSRGWGVGREKSYGQGTGLFDGVSSSPRSPRGSFRSASLHHCCCCCAQEGVVHASLLSFCTSFSQLSRYGLATPSSHDGCCAGAPICRQSVLRTLCFTKCQGRKAKICGVSGSGDESLASKRGTKCTQKHPCPEMHGFCNFAVFAWQGLRERAWQGWQGLA